MKDEKVILGIRARDEAMMAYVIEKYSKLLWSVVYPVLANAVSDGTVLETGFDAIYGYYIILDLGEEITVKYGHLEETKVNEKDVVSKGQKIATVGATGMATGPNLAFFVYLNGEPINPLATEDDM